jgi:broad specificity phosphatase PhoE
MPDPATIPGIIDAAIAEATAWGTAHREVALVRHGQPLPEADRRGREALDPPLSALGRRQAAAASSALAEVEAVYSSDLARARETAQIIGDGLGVPVQAVAGLREITVYRESEDEESSAPAWREAAAAFVAGGRWEAFLQPGLDPSFRSRVRLAIHEITADRTAGPVAVVCHRPPTSVRTC